MTLSRAISQDGALREEKGTKTHQYRRVVSPWTVQDHLKSTFAKVGVTNRRELTTAIFMQQYGPRIGGPLGPAGGFLPGS